MLCLHLQEQAASWKAQGDKRKQDWFSLLPTVMPPPCPPSPSHPQALLLPRVPFWSQNPLCQCKNSPAFSCSTHHVTLENLQGIFHLASATRGHRDPRLPAFSGLAAPARASHSGGRRAPLGGEQTTCGVCRPGCQQTAALVFHCRPFIGLGEIRSFPGTKSTS